MLFADLRYRRLWAAMLSGIGLVLGTGMGTTAAAAGLQVAPVRLDFGPQHRVQQLRIGNRSDDNLVVQITLYRWDQVDGEDRLSPDRDFLATPSILEVPAGGQKMVRVGVRNRPTGPCENTYRLIVTEIPSQQEQSHTPVKFVTRMSLPLFAYNTDNCKPKLQWRRQRQNLQVSNAGDAHELILRMEIQQNGVTWPMVLPSMGYVHAAKSRSFTLPSELDHGPATLHWLTKDGGQSVLLPAID